MEQAAGESPAPPTWQGNYTTEDTVESPPADATPKFDLYAGTDLEEEARRMQEEETQAAEFERNENGAYYLQKELPREVRHAFIRKVYLILMFQLSIAFGISLMFVLWDEAGQWIIANWWFPVTMFIVGFIVLCVFACVPGLDKKTPWNHLVMTFFSLCMGTLLGYLAAFLEVAAFGICLGITLGVVLICTIVAMNPWFDFTNIWMILALGSILFGVLIIVLWIMPRDTEGYQILLTIVVFFGVFLYSGFLIIDTQRILGGTHHRHRFSTDEYWLASLMLYLDIVNIFSLLMMGARAA